MQEKASKLARSGHNRRRREIVSDVADLQYWQLLAKWPLFLEETCRYYGVVGKDLYSVFTIESVHNLHLKISRLLNTFFSHCFSPDEIWSA